jgi:two-component system, OmpR family, phosphate regulon sensor histidine kinase PhoR
MRSHLYRRVFIQCLITLLVMLSILGIIEYYFILENRAWVFFGMGIASAVFVAWYLTVRLEQELLQPIREMTKATRQMTGKQIRFQFMDEYVDELAMLGKTLTEMGHRIQRNIGEITEEKNKIQAIIECMSDGVIALDKRGRIVLLNPAAEAMFKVKGSDIMNKPFLQVVRNYQLAQVFQEAIAQGEPICRKVELVTPAVWILKIEITPLRSENQEIFGVVGVIHDISELTRVERMRTDFVANVSHELRTPLTSIKGFVETLLAGAMAEPVTCKRFLEIVSSEANRLDQLIADLLSLSEIESKRKPFKWEEFSLIELIHEKLNILGMPLQKKGLQLQMLLPHHLPKVVADRGQIGQVLINLIDNAIKYTPKSQTITVSAWQEEENLVVCVADTGMGISQESLPRLFERFYRVDAARSREMGGTGLGLSIVKHIMEGHAGKVWVESEWGQGSKFFFSLPLKPQELTRI